MPRLARVRSWADVWAHAGDRLRPIGWISLTGLLAARLLQSAAMMALVSVVSFGLVAFAPVDPARMALSAGGSVTIIDERDLELKRRELGLDRPILERYVRWWADLSRLDLGSSFMSRRSVRDMIAERLVPSAVLAVLALGMSVGIGLPLGVLSATRAGTWVDSATRFVALLGTSLPGFWIALLFMWLFAVHLRWLPALGSFTPAGIVLPMLVLGLRPMGRLTRLMRATMLDAMRSEFVDVARAKGLSQRTVLWRHIVPNALLPAIAVIGLDFTALLANAAVVEWVFAWPGIGRLGVDAALAGDLPVIMGFVLLVGWMVVLVNLTVDLAYGLVDPRLRLAAAA